MITPSTRENGNAWDSKEEDPLWLVTESELDQLPDGTTLHCINGTTVVKGTSYIDTRFGVLAYGLRESQLTGGYQEA